VDPPAFLTPWANMHEQSQLNDRIGSLIHDVNQGCPDARQQLLIVTSDRLERLTRSMKKDFPSVSRWEETGDVFQNAMIRLNQALTKVEINDVRHFLRLAALHIRRELIDLCRKHNRRNKLHQTQQPNTNEDSGASPLNEGFEVTNDPQRVAQWGEFHATIEALPDDQKEIVELLWYHGLSQTAAAEVMGLTIKQVRGLWRSARLQLHEALGGQGPELS